MDRDDGDLDLTNAELAVGVTALTNGFGLARLIDPDGVPGELYAPLRDRLASPTPQRVPEAEG